MGQQSLAETNSTPKERKPYVEPVPKSDDPFVYVQRSNGEIMRMLLASEDQVDDVGVRKAYDPKYLTLEDVKIPEYKRVSSLILEPDAQAALAKKFQQAEIDRQINEETLDRVKVMLEMEPDHTREDMVEVLAEEATEDVVPSPVYHDKLHEYSEARTVEMALILSEDDLDAMDAEISKPDAKDSIKALAADESFRTYGGIKVSGKNFAFSRILMVGEREYAVAYTKGRDTEVRPRLFYKSNSDGGWRATSEIDNGYLSKGDNDGKYGEYVQVSKPTEHVSAYLDHLSSQGISVPMTSSHLESIFSKQRIKGEDDERIEDAYQTDKVISYGLDAYIPGYGFENAEVGRKKLENMSLPYGFEPDFTRPPERRYAIDHTILGKAGVDVYKGAYKNASIEWHVAHDEDGRVWLERLEYESNRVTSYGTEANILVAGALNMKPVEYHYQTGGEDGVDYDMIDRRYADMQKTIDRMPWVKRFKQAQNITS